MNWQWVGGFSSSGRWLGGMLLLGGGFFFFLIEDWEFFNLFLWVMS